MLVELVLQSVLFIVSPPALPPYGVAVSVHDGLASVAALYPLPPQWLGRTLYNWHNIVGAQQPGINMEMRSCYLARVRVR